MRQVWILEPAGMALDMVAPARNQTTNNSTVTAVPMAKRMSSAFTLILMPWRFGILKTDLERFFFRIKNNFIVHYSQLLNLIICMISALSILAVSEQLMMSPLIWKTLLVTLVKLVVSQMTPDMVRV